VDLGTTSLFWSGGPEVNKTLPTARTREETGIALLRFVCRALHL